MLAADGEEAAVKNGVLEKMEGLETGSGFGCGVFCSSGSNASLDVHASLPQTSRRIDESMSRPPSKKRRFVREPSDGNEGQDNLLRLQSRTSSPQGRLVLPPRPVSCTLIPTRSASTATSIFSGRSILRLHRTKLKSIDSTHPELSHGQAHAERKP